MDVNGDEADGRGIVYVIGEVGAGAGPAVKIGLAKDEKQLHARLHSFATGNPRKLEILHSESREHPRWIEHQLHVVLDPWRSSESGAREWFNVRHLGERRWPEFIADALAGGIPQSGPLPGPQPIPGHRLLHLTGREPGTLSSICSCDWASPRTSVPKALAAIERHIAEHSGNGGQLSPP